MAYRWQTFVFDVAVQVFLDACELEYLLYVAVWKFFSCIVSNNQREKIMTINVKLPA